MKHIRGNSPRCDECFYYDIGHFKSGDLMGICKNDYNCTHGVNGYKLDKRRDFYLTRSMLCCSRWEDAEERISYFDVITGLCYEPGYYGDLFKGD